MTHKKGTKEAVQEVKVAGNRSGMDFFSTGGISANNLELLPQGTILNNSYRIEKFIGAGASAQVYQVVSLQEDEPDKRFAAKVFAPNDKRVSAREVNLLTGVDHANIVQFLTFDNDEATSRPFIIMELVPGQSLAAELEQAKATGNRLQWSERTWKNFLDLLLAVQYLHEQEILHLDIKPNNIMHLPDDTFKLLDFGIAKNISKETTFHQLGIWGSLGYMCPEQVQGEKADVTFDLYAFASTIFHVLTGMPAIGEIKSSFKQLAQAAGQMFNLDALETVLFANLSLAASDRDKSAKRLYENLQACFCSEQEHQISQSITSFCEQVLFKHEPQDFIGRAQEAQCLLEKNCAYVAKHKTDNNVQRLKKIAAYEEVWERFPQAKEDYRSLLNEHCHIDVHTSYWVIRKRRKQAQRLLKEFSPCFTVEQKEWLQLAASDRDLRKPYIADWDDSIFWGTTAVIFPYVFLAVSFIMWIILWRLSDLILLKVITTSYWGLLCFSVIKNETRGAYVLTKNNYGYCFWSYIKLGVNSLVIYFLAYLLFMPYCEMRAPFDPLNFQARYAPVLSFAGTGVADYREGKKDLAQFSRPTGLAIDNDGDLFVADTKNHVIRVIYVSRGEVRLFAGAPAKGPGLLDGPRLQALFSQPTSLAFDSQQNLYVIDQSNRSLRKIALNGQVSTVFTLTVPPLSAIARIIGLTTIKQSLIDQLVVGKDGTVYFAARTRYIHLAKKLHKQIEVEKVKLIADCLKGISPFWGEGCGSLLENIQSKTEVVLYKFVAGKVEKVKEFVKVDNKIPQTELPDTLTVNRVTGFLYLGQQSFVSRLAGQDLKNFMGKDSSGSNWQWQVKLDAVWFERITAMAFDQDGILYLVDSHKDKGLLRRIDLNGLVTNISRLPFVARDLVIAGKRIYFADSLRNRICYLQLK